ncbi:CocE/NonD family hydrolase [Lentzea sp. CA-135723]|uniref:CocE/NonD family hydrolase n=1 Tax=Lentzea sp. CA-135723 TaxID=3239950 RepID=UPI003D8C0F75
MKPKPAGLLARAAGAVHGRAFGLPPGGVRYAVERGIRVPMKDGAELMTDLYAPIGASHGTVLVRTPYGRGLPESLFHGRAFAAQGYQVLIQSVRGTGGSTGAFRPIVQETSDSQDVMAWLRRQPWFSGRLATLGGSYLGWAQWALLQDPPPELCASVVLVGPHDFSEAIRGTGSLALADWLGWSASMRAMRRGGVRDVVASRRRVSAALREQTPARAAKVALGDEAPWFDEWLSHDRDDPFWRGYDAGSALTVTKVPTLVVGGWHDVFVDQTLAQFQALDEREVDVAMTIGPWTHLDTAVRASRVVDAEALTWLDQHVAGKAATRDARVRVYVTGAEEWRAMQSWQPHTGALRLRPDATGVLGAEPGSGVVEFSYDPADPTPSVGGRHMSAKAGRQDNRELERRPDVVTFTTAPLDEDVEVVGAPVIELQLDRDVFVRLCDVDSRGRSWNVTETFGRPGSGRLTLGSCAHRFRAGHRIRLQISGGAYPRYARNPEPCHYAIDCAGTTLILPARWSPE